MEVAKFRFLPGRDAGLPQESAWGRVARATTLASSVAVSLLACALLTPTGPTASQQVLSSAPRTWPIGAVSLPLEPVGDFARLKKRGVRGRRSGAQT